MSLIVQAVFEQKGGNLAISCLSHPFSVISVETRKCLHGPVAVRSLFDALLLTFSKTAFKPLSGN